MMGNHASKKAAAAAHNARYESKRAGTKKPVKMESVNMGAIGKVDSGETKTAKAVKPERRGVLFAAMAAMSGIFYRTSPRG